MSSLFRRVRSMSSSRHACSCSPSCWAAESITAMKEPWSDGLQGHQRPESPDMGQTCAFWTDSRTGPCLPPPRRQLYWSAATTRPAAPPRDPGLRRRPAKRSTPRRQSRGAQWPAIWLVGRDEEQAVYRRVASKLSKLASGQRAAGSEESQHAPLESNREMEPPRRRAVDDHDRGAQGEQQRPRGGAPHALESS